VLKKYRTLYVFVLAPLANVAVAATTVRAALKVVKNFSLRIGFSFSHFWWGRVRLRLCGSFACFPHVLQLIPRSNCGAVSHLGAHHRIDAYQITL
jgi:hypothetical protein